MLVKRVGNDCVFDENLERNDSQGGLVGGLEHDGAASSGLLHLQPASGADAPAITRLETLKAELRHWCREVVTQLLRDTEELLIDDAADGVDAEVIGASLAAAGAVEAGHWLTATDLERLAENVSAAGFDWFLDGFCAGHRKSSLNAILFSGEPSIPLSRGTCDSEDHEIVAGYHSYIHANYCAGERTPALASPDSVGY